MRHYVCNTQHHFRKYCSLYFIDISAEVQRGKVRAQGMPWIQTWYEVYAISTLLCCLQRCLAYCLSFRWYVKSLHQVHATSGRLYSSDSTNCGLSRVKRHLNGKSRSCPLVPQGTRCKGNPRKVGDDIQ